MSMKGEKRKMRKLVKKIATVALAASMTAAMSVSAFAADFYQFVGNPNLFGDADQGNDKIGWVPTVDTQNFTAVDGQDDLYVYTSTYALPSDQTPNEDPKKDPMNLSTQFKVLADGQDFAWNYQMCLGIPESAWADNQSQFKVVGDFQPGEFKVYMDPKKGFVCIIQNNKSVELNVRYHSKDEESWNFVALTRKAIIGDGYADSSVYFKDDEYKAFVDKCLGLGSAAAPAATAAPAVTEAATTAAPVETQPATTAGTGVKSNTNSPKTGDVAPVAMLAVLAAAVAVTVAAKRKEA